MGTPPPTVVGAVVTVTPVRSPVVSVVYSVIHPLHQPDIGVTVAVTVGDTATKLPAGSGGEHAILIFNGMVSRATTVTVEVAKVATTGVLFRGRNVSSSLGE